LVPLGAFAVDNTAAGTCDFYIKYLDSSNHVNSDKVILGSMFL